MSSFHIFAKIDKSNLNTPLIQSFNQTELSDTWNLGSSHSILRCPFLSSCIKLRSVCFVHVHTCNFWNQGVIWVGVGEQRADGQKNLADGQCRWPLRPQDVQIDAPFDVDVGVVDACREIHLWRLKGVVSGEVDGEKEDPSLVGAVWGPREGGLPVKEVITDWACWAICWGVSHKVLQFFLYPFQCHFVKFLLSESRPTS